MRFPVQTKLLISSFIVLYSLDSYSQPANDNCTSAAVITISNNGYGVGVFNSTIDNITAATVQTGETFAPAILTAGQSVKSLWYKFTLPTTRSVKVTLGQTGSAITAGDVGFTVYKAN